MILSALLAVLTPVVNVVLTAWIRSVFPGLPKESADAMPALIKGAVNYVMKSTSHTQAKQRIRRVVDACTGVGCKIKTPETMVGNRIDTKGLE